MNIEIIKNFINYIKDSGIIELLALLVSITAIKTSLIQVRTDKRLSVKPYISFEILEFMDEKETYIENIKLLVKMKVLDPIFINKFKDKIKSFKLRIHNCGSGSIVRCRVISAKFDNKHININECDLGFLDKNNYIDLKIDLYYHINSHYIDLLNKNYENDLNKIKCIRSQIQKETSKKIYLTIEYIDILDNKYERELCINFYLFLSIQTKNSIISTPKELLPNVDILNEESKDRLKKENKAI